MGFYKASSLTLALCVPSLSKLVHCQGLKRRPVQTPPTFVLEEKHVWQSPILYFQLLAGIFQLPARRLVFPKKLDIRLVKYITSKPASTCNYFSFLVPDGYLNHHGLTFLESPFISPLIPSPEFDKFFLILFCGERGFHCYYPKAVFGFLAKVILITILFWSHVPLRLSSIKNKI